MRGAPRLAVDVPLKTGMQLVMEGAQAHYLRQVMRVQPGDAVTLLTQTSGVWGAVVAALEKRRLTLAIGECIAPPEMPVGLMACFAPIRGGRLETLIEKATELGAQALYPVLTERTVVTRLHAERAEHLMRESAEQCERAGWPVLHPLQSLSRFLGNWPADIPLFYADESGDSPPFSQLASGIAAPPSCYGVLTGPEGGFSPSERALLARAAFARGVSLGPRILRADTALIALMTLSLSHWGDWHARPRFTQPSSGEDRAP